MFQFLLLFLRFHFEIPVIGDQNIFVQKLDHFNSSDNVYFNQIYYINSTYLDPLDPSIVIYIGGESTMSYSNSIPKGLLESVTMKSNSTFLALEHRFYGKSAPVGLDSTTENLKKYLTSDQALADLANFITKQKEEICKQKTNCPVLVVGGSYAGTLSSMFRMKYPHLVNYSLASSPPLNIKLDFTEYDEHVGQSIKKRNADCQTKAKYFMDQIENNETAYDYFRKNTRFNMSTDRVSCLSCVADFYAGMVQYDLRSNSINNYCDLNIDNFNDFVKHFDETNPNPDDSDELLLNDPSYDRPIDYKNSRSWAWQTCNEFGWFQTASKNENARFRAKALNLAYYDRVCKTLFNVSLPNVDDINLRYGLTSPKTTNVIYVNGMTDPWSEVSIQDNQVDHSKQQYSIHIEEGSHCSDLSYDETVDLKYPNLKKKRSKIMAIIMNWFYFNETLCSENGTPGLSCCICNEHQTGINCESLSVAESTFMVFSGLVVALPTLMMIVIGIAAWKLFQKEQSEPQIRTIIS